MSCCCLWLDILLGKCNKSLQACCGKMCGSHRPQWPQTGTHFYLLIHWDNTEEGLSVHSMFSTPHCSPVLRIWESIFFDNVNVSLASFPVTMLLRLQDMGPSSSCTRCVWNHDWNLTPRPGRHLDLPDLTGRLGEGDSFWTFPHLKSIPLFQLSHSSCFLMKARVGRFYIQWLTGKFVTSELPGNTMELVSKPHPGAGLILWQEQLLLIINDLCEDISHQGGGAGIWDAWWVHKSLP